MYWIDLEHDNVPWHGLLVTLDDYDRKPCCYIQSGHPSRLRLVINDTPVLWATPEEGYYGVWLLHNHNASELISQVVGFIHSSDIEHRKQLAREEWHKSWCKFFTARLLASEYSFLHQGLWQVTVLTGFQQSSTGEWGFNTPAIPYAYKTHVSRYLFFRPQTLFAQNPVNHDWCGSKNENLIVLKPENTDDSRLKWWRKKIHENALPPILVWYIQGLCAYVVIDGHSRLLAAIKENYQPDFIVFESVKQHSFQPDVAKQEALVNGLARQIALNPQIKTEIFNEVLCEAFNDRPALYGETQAIAAYNLNQTWCAEVTAKPQELGKEEYLGDFL